MTTKPLPLYIFNLQGQWIALIDDYTELIWTISHKPGGSFELVVPYHKRVFEWAKEDYLVVTDIFETNDENFFKKEPGTVPMIIDSVLETLSEETKSITISGKSFDSILHRRRIVPMISIAIDEKSTGMFPSQIVWHLMEKIATNPRNIGQNGADLGLDLVRYFPNTTMEQPTWPMGDESVQDGPYLSKEYLGEDLFDAIHELCTSWNLGFRVRSIFSENSVCHIFYLATGIDFSLQSDGKHGFIILSKDVSYIPESTHLRSSAHFKNIVYIKGARKSGSNLSNNPGEIYSARRPGDPTGYALREGFLDGSGLPANVDDPKFPTENYKTILRLAAADYLYGDEGSYIDVVEADIFASYTLGKDYGLGDTVSIEDENGVQNTAVVTDILFTHNDVQRSLRPIFSFQNRTINLDP